MYSTQDQTEGKNISWPNSAAEEYEAEPPIVQNAKQKRTELSVKSPDAGLGFTLSKKQRSSVVE